MSLSEFYFSLEGRISRKEYWLKYILALSIPAVFLGVFIARTTGNEPLWKNITMLILLWPSIAVQVKRWHDRDKSGWWILMNLVPIIGPAWALVENGFLSGTVGENRFGLDPLGAREGREAKSGGYRFFIAIIAILTIAVWASVFVGREDPTKNQKVAGQGKKIYTAAEKAKALREARRQGVILSRKSKGAIPSVETEGNKVTITAGAYHIVAEKQSEVSGSYLLVGGSPSQSGFEYMSGSLMMIPVAQARQLSQQYGDFLNCDSPGASVSQRSARHMTLIGADKIVDQKIREVAKLAQNAYPVIVIKAEQLRIIKGRFGQHSFTCSPEPHCLVTDIKIVQRNYGNTK